jgi:acyl-coenzyme A synthetase/AMP-(fatty) acid ligase
MAAPLEAGPQLLRRWIARAAGRDPEKPWIISAEDDRVITYGELRRLAAQMAGLLRERGIVANDRVVLLANNSIEHLASYIGVIAYGATICTIHVEMNRPDLDRILPALRPRLILFEEGLGVEGMLSAIGAPSLPLGRWDDRTGESLFAAARRVEPGEGHVRTTERDDAVILFTSGTSARPKGVVLTFRELLSNAEPTAQGFGLTADDRIYDFRSFNWCSAQTLSALPPIARGATLVLGRKFSRSRFFTYIHAYGATVATGNPTTLGMLLNGDDPRGVELPRLRFITSSSAPLLVEEWRRFEQRFGIRVSQGYGSSETGWIAAHPGENRRWDTVGRPLAYHRLAIVDEAGRPLPAGEIGAVELGGFSDNAYRYLGEDGTVQVASRGRIRTGDLGFLDEDGFLHLTGRERELIIRGGVNISPVEIDSLLMQHPELIEAATIGIPDPIYGEEVVSYVVARPGSRVDDAELLRFCTSRIPAFKAPKRIMFARALPKNERGKLDRRALRAQWLRQR